MEWGSNQFYPAKFGMGKKIWLQDDDLNNCVAYIYSCDKRTVMEAVHACVMTEPLTLVLII